MRILFFHAYPHQFAGAQRLTLALARELAAQGHVAAVVVTDDGPFADRLRESDVPMAIVRAPAPLRVYGGRLEGRRALPALAVLPGYWLRLRRAIGSWRPDVVHVNDHRGALLAAPAARLAGAPVVWHLHGPYGSSALTRLAGTLARRIVVVSEATRREQRGLERFRAKTTVVHNGLLTGATGRRERAESRGRRGNPLVVTGARLHPDKGIDVLLRATELLRRRFPQVRVVVAGAPQPGYERHHAELLDLRHELELERTVEFCGLLRDPLDLWRRADVYVQPSRREPFGLGVLEAMSVGTPVVATAAGGLAEVLEPGVSGLQVSPGHPDELASAIARVLADPPLATRLGASGVERARVFSKERMVGRMLEVYADAAREGGR